MAEAMIEVNKLSKLYLSGALFKKASLLSEPWMMCPSGWKRGKYLGLLARAAVVRRRLPM